MRLSIIALLLGTSGFAFSQAPMSWFEVGVFGGVSNYYGDLTQDYVVVKESEPAFGGFIKYNMSYQLGVKLNVNHGRVTAADANSDRADQLLRNLSFTSEVTEVGLVLEYSFPGLYPKELRRPFSPYVNAGIAGFRFNPQAFYRGEWYDLQPLGTEGQGINEFDFREPYSLYELAIPFAIGVKWAFSERWNLGLEYAARWTFTDYLDDVSRTYVERNLLIEENGIDAYNLSNRSGEFLNADNIPFDNNDFRGDPTNNDWYMFFGITLSRNFIAGAEEGFLSVDKPGLGCFQPKYIKKHKKKNYRSTR
jgi:opacity protein-like surface antigen